jgi:predicted Zn-ribbon and HTH transcriptional regulator
MPREGLEVADIFRAHGPAWRRASAGHLSLGQLKVMSAIERCRTAALGGHVAACQDCGHIQVADNSCRNRHCPKCQGAAARAWLAARQAELLPVAYYHVVFTLPAPVAEVAYQNKAVVYGLLFKAAAETLITIAADPRHLGARIGLTAVLHSWGAALTHHPHLHCIVPGGGLSLDGRSWVSCRPGFFLPVRVLSRLFRRRVLEQLAAAHQAGHLRFFNHLAPLQDRGAFADLLAPLRKTDWVVYAKRPFAGPEAVLAYLSRYTHRVAIANSRLIAFDDHGVTFKWKDYRAPKANGGRDRHKTMTLAAHEFIRRFLLHVLPQGFHRIRHYGLFANGGRAQNLARARQLLAIETRQDAPGPGADDDDQETQTLAQPCPSCGGPMIIIETFEPGYTPSGHAPRAPPPSEADSP